MTGAVLRACFLPLLRVRKRGAYEDKGDGLHSLEVVRDRERVPVVRGGIRDGLHTYFRNDFRFATAISLHNCTDSGVVSWDAWRLSSAALDPQSCNGDRREREERRKRRITAVSQTTDIPMAASSILMRR